MKSNRKIWLVLTGIFALIAVVAIVWLVSYQNKPKNQQKEYENLR